MEVVLAESIINLYGYKRIIIVHDTYYYCHMLIGTEISLVGFYNNNYRGSAPVHMGNVQCSGSESRLIDCPHSAGGRGSAARLTCNYNTDDGK